MPENYEKIVHNLYDSSSIYKQLDATVSALHFTTETADLQKSFTNSVSRLYK